MQRKKRDNTHGNEKKMKEDRWRTKAAKNDVGAILLKLSDRQ